MNLDFSKLKVLVIGDVMLDIYLYGTSDRESPEAPIPVLVPKNEKFFLGGAGNVAMNTKALGARVFPIGIIGVDYYSQKFTDLFNKNNIETDGLIRSKKSSITTKKRIFINNKQILRIDNDSKILKKDFDNLLLKKINRYVKNCNVIILSDYDKGVISKKIAHHCIKLGQELKIPVIIDPKKNSLKYYNGATVITPNLNEAKLLSGLNKISDIISYLKNQMIKFNINYIVLKIGKKGMILIEKDNHKKFDAIKVKNPDVTGAGDTVISILSLMFALKNNINDCIKYSNIAAGKVVAKNETSYVLKNEIF